MTSSSLPFHRCSTPSMSGSSLLTRATTPSLDRPLYCLWINQSGRHLDNEKLEHVGDALLGAVITILLDRLYPTLHEGGATLVKAHLVRDSFLAQLSRRYNLHARLIAKPSDIPSLVSLEKPVANLFEAYVAGLFQSFLQDDTKTRGQAIDHVESWLYPLFTPLAHWVVGRLHDQQARIEATRTVSGNEMEEDKLAQGWLARLNQHFVHQEGGIPQFEQVFGGSGWTMRCIALKKDGTELTGEATRATKQAAKTVAAWKVCEQMGWL